MSHGEPAQQSPILAEAEPEQASPTERFLRTRFLELLAHDLRGPTGVVLGALNEIALELSPEQTERAAGLFSMARRSLRRILRLSDRLNRTGQLERGAVSLAPALSDVRELVQRATEDAEQLEARRNVAVELSLPPLPALLVADAEWLTVALSDVVASAVRSARRRVEVSVAHQGERVVIAVADDGTAGPELSMARFQESTGRSGLGLALALAREVVETHGGQMALSTGRGATAAGEVSANPAGVRVEITLPLAPPQP